MAPRAPPKRKKTKKRVFLVIGDPNGLPKKISAIFGGFSLEITYPEVLSWSTYPLPQSWRLRSFPNESSWPLLMAELPKSNFEWRPTSKFSRILSNEAILLILQPFLVNLHLLFEWRLSYPHNARGNELWLKLGLELRLDLKNSKYGNFATIEKSKGFENWQITFFQDFYQKPKHVKRVPRVQIMQVFYNTLGPLKWFFRKCPTTVQSHDSCQIFQFFVLFWTDGRNIFRTSNTKLISIFVMLDHVWQKSNDVHWKGQILKK